MDESLVRAAARLRRELHAHPEPGFEETWTQERLRRALREVAGIDGASVVAMAKTGLVVDIAGPAGGETPRIIALRADMDALRMQELNPGLPYRSTRDGYAHMCGHDGHMAGLVLAAALVARRRDRLPAGAVVRLLFQPAEEGGRLRPGDGHGGALPMIRGGALDGVAEVYGCHNLPTAPVGEVRVTAGAVMGRSTELRISIRGKGGHASQPHNAVDPVVAGALVLSALQTVVARTVPASQSAVVSVTNFNAGSGALNVIPDVAALSGTIRDFDDGTFALLADAVPRVVKGVCAGLGAAADVAIDTKYPPVVNPADGADAVARAAARLGVACSGDGLPLLAGEDFSYFLRPGDGGLASGAFFFVGTAEEAYVAHAALDLDRPGAFADAAPRSNTTLHNTAYDFNDNALPVAAAMFVAILGDRFGVALYDPEELLPPSRR